MLENKNVQEQYDIIKDLTSEAYANITMMNSLKILGVKKSQAKDALTEKDYTLINEYKFPDRLIKMMEMTSERFQGHTYSVSFAKIALDHGL